MFPFNWVPQRVGTVKIIDQDCVSEPVSIQLGSPASGDLEVRRMTRGANESFSAITPPVIGGDQVTTQVLPLHRATMTWLLGKPSGATLLYNDLENEIVAIPDGAQVMYWGKLPLRTFRVEKDGSLTKDPPPP